MRVLVIHGGGVRGVIPAVFLSQIENHFGKIADNFDLIIGTSTGGILASALATGIESAQILDFYEQKSPGIFNRGAKLKSGFGFFDQLYSNKLLKKELESLVFGNLSETKCRLMLTAYDLDKRKNVLFDTRTAQMNPYHNYKVTDCVRATTAAPTYFEPVEVQNSQKTYTMHLVDGGVAGMNNPIFVALSKLILEGHKPENIKVLELGTGSYEVPIEFEKAKKWGLAKWVKPVIDIMLDGSSDLMTDFAKKILKPENYLTIQRTINEPEMAKIDNAKRDNLLKLKGLAGFLNRTELEKIKLIIEKDDTL